MKIRVLLADDHVMVRDALAGILDAESDIETVARNVSSWIRTSASSDEVASDALFEPLRALRDPVLIMEKSWQSRSLVG